jgi:DNA recombination protein RmuC
MVDMQFLPWLIVTGILFSAAVFFARKAAACKRELEVTSKVMEQGTQELAAFKERLNAREEEFGRRTVEWERQVAVLIREKDGERNLYEEMNRECARLKAGWSAQIEKTARLDELKEEATALKERVEALFREKGEREAELAALTSVLEQERKAAREKIVLLEQAESRLAKEFELLANRIFEEKHRKFDEASRTGIEGILKPVRDQLSEFRKKVEDVYDNENRDRASLRTEIQSLKSLNERIGADALNLTRALKGDSKVRGTWGEIQLERLLEESGLVKGREYHVQTGYRDEDGRRFNPDVVVHLPERKDVVIDSKVSLVDYERYSSSETDEERKNHLKSHIASIRAHVTGLNLKNYDELIGVNSLDIVIMFVPIEPALLLAFEHEPRLFNEAFSKKILLVSPSTLMSTLQIIHNIWRYEYQNMNARTIAVEAGKLHDQFVGFVESLEKIGDQIRKAGEIYDLAHKRLVSGRGNLVGRARNLKLLGAKTRKDLSGELLEASMDNDVENSELTMETTGDGE